MYYYLISKVARKDVLGEPNSEGTKLPTIRQFSINGARPTSNTLSKCPIKDERLTQ